MAKPDFGLAEKPATNGHDPRISEVLGGCRLDTLADHADRLLPQRGLGPIEMTEYPINRSRQRDRCVRTSSCLIPSEDMADRGEAPAARISMEKPIGGDGGLINPLDSQPIRQRGGILRHRNNPQRQGGRTLQELASSHIEPLFEAVGIRPRFFFDFWPVLSIRLTLATC